MTGHRIDLDGKTPAVGTFFKSGSPNLAEALGHTALDFLLIDRQHASLSISSVEEVIRAADLNGLPTLVRLRGHETSTVNSLLDVGADGLVIPQVEAPDTVRSIRDAAQYGGTRSFAMSTRAGRFGARDREEYLKWVTSELTLVAQIESNVGVDQAAAIGSVDGLDGLMVGPADLAQSLNVPAGSEEHTSMINKVYDAAVSAGCSAGTYVGSTEALSSERDQAGFLVYNSDVGLASEGIRQALKKLG